MSEDGEKTLAPSARRLADAARKGDVLRSRELATAATVLAGAAWLTFAGPRLFEALLAVVRSGLIWDRVALDEFASGAVMLPLMEAILPLILSFGGAVLVATVAIQLGLSGQGRWIVGNLVPKPSRLNPVSGLKRMFGATGWIELAKGLAKLALLGAIAWGWASANLASLSEWSMATLSGQLRLVWQASASLLFALGAGLALIAAIDWPLQFVRRLLRLKMTQQEFRDEHKEAEGSPERKAAQRNRGRQLAMGGVAKAMREAQFVITNPRHFAVAMAYDPARAAAPIVLAKGRGDRALAIRELAAERAVPCLEYPELARAVYFTSRDGQSIREELYAAVATVLAFVLALKRGEPGAMPMVEVPVALRFDADGRLGRTPA